MKKVLTKMSALVLALFMLATLAACGQSDGKPAQSSPAQTGDTSHQTPTGNVEKPEKIVLFVDTVFGSMMEQSTFAPFREEYKNRTGIEIEFIKPDHNKYYEQMSLAFTSGNIPDMVEIGSSQYPTYANNGALWDMTDAWENSALKASGIVDEKYVEALKLDGRLYGFPMVRGNGTITYVRKDWLDNLNMEIPTTYDEFIEMLRAFTFDDPDQNGKDDTFGLTAPGLVNSETPYAIYLPEFYQDAVPDFIEKDGKWVDGMQQPEMIEALTRMKEAYKDGLIDVEVVTNKTSSCRDKFYAGQCGVFNYWAGNWNVTLEKNVQANNPDAVVVPIPAIEGIHYIERPPIALAITNAATNPEGIFEYLIEYSHDGGEGELLFSRGVEGVNYEKTADGYQQLPDPENVEKLFEKTFYAPELSITTFAKNDIITLDERITNSLALFDKDSVIYPVPESSDIISENMPELITIRNNAIANAVTTDMTPEEAIAQYLREAKQFIDAILADLNK